MFYKQKDRLRRWIFSRQVRSVFDTPPVRLTDVETAPLVLSQLQHKDVTMYLAAIKSFVRYLPPREIHIVDDGSLTDHDRAVLERHIPGVLFHPLASCREPGLPQGGTWERLIAIARLSRSGYVIQLDADTLTLSAVDEVRVAAKDGRSFSIGTWDKQEIELATERARDAQRHLRTKTPHIQVLAESNLHALNEASGLKYVRGCSGFAGFSISPHKLEFMQVISEQMLSLMGTRWFEWGSEQVMSNLIIANQLGAVVLPHPEYSDCEKLQPSRTRFVHFIGTCRFRNGRYAQLVNKVVSQLSEGETFCA